MYDNVCIALRDQANKLEAKIESKLNPAIAKKNPTNRRAGILASMREDGYILQKIQTVLNELAQMREDGTLPSNLRLITKKSQVEILVKYEQIWECHVSAMTEIGVYDDRSFKNVRLMLLSFVDEGKYNAERRKNEIMNAALDLISIVPGYFPTPHDVVDLMLNKLAEEYEIQELVSVFDPSAGSGFILERVRDLYPRCDVSGVEVNYSLAELCRLKALNVQQGDIFQYSGQHDLIIANPPFENDLDCRHAIYYFNHLLRPGGHMCLITGAGAFFHKSDIAEKFREMVEEFGGYEDLPEGSFKKSKTGVNTCMIWLEKPL